jgi:hypothetical protein
MEREWEAEDAGTDGAIPKVEDGRPCGRATFDAHSATAHCGGGSNELDNSSRRPTLRHRSPEHHKRLNTTETTMHSRLLSRAARRARSWLRM